MKKIISWLSVFALLSVMIPSVSASSSLKTEFFGASSYLSGEMKTKGKFSGVIVKYHQEESADDFIDFKIRFDEGNKWSEWISIRPDHDHSDESEHSDSNEYLINSNESRGYQIYVGVLEGKDAIMPELKIEKLTFINAKAGEPTSSVGAFSIDSNPNVISRSEWGADESLMYGSGLEVTDEEHEDINRVVYKENGKELKWPKQYMEDVKMLVVHHTASVSDLNNPKQAIRNIYYYHTVRRGWGDIGYNYIIDTDGRIYEGRSGGEMVVGGHSVKVNKASIGVAVLGNYQTQEVPKDVVQGLTNILSSKAKKYDLDVLDDVKYADEDFPVLGGHRDSASTACPGENLYRALPTIRYLVSGAEVYEDTDKLSRWRYAYIDDEPLKDMMDLEFGETKTVSIKLKNVGKKEWNPRNSYLKIENYNAIKDMVKVDGWKIGELSSDVDTGQSVTFEFDVTGSLGTGFQGLELLMVMNGTAQTSLPIYVPLYLDNDFTFDVSGTDDFELDMDPGETREINVKFKNTSSIDWNSKHDVVLSKTDGTSSRLLKNGDVIGEINKNRFKTVSFDITAPASKGSYTEYFAPSLEGGLLFEGDPIKVTVNVGGSSSGSKSSTVKTSKPLVLNSSVDAKVKQKTVHTIELVNKTSQTWKKSDFTVTSVGSRSVDIKNIELVESSVGPGSLGNVRMEITPQKLGKFKYQFRFFNGKKLVYSTPYRLVVTTDGSGSTAKSTTTTTTTKTTTKVVPTVEASAPAKVSTSNSFGPNIRVRLSVFDIDETEIDPHGLTDIYVDDVKLTSITALEDAKVSEYSSEKVRVDANGETKIGRIVRFVPSSEQGTITMTDLENRPAWNRSLNDNRYRGTLEFRMDDLQFIVINELPLELYLRGLGEVSNGTHSETMKTILTAARSYAYHYITDGEKFAGKPYNLDDSPARSQKYIGYGFELRSPNVTKAVKETAGKVVTYDNEVIKVPYFSKSNGRTKSAQEVWGWTNTPYLVSVDDPYCAGQTPAGHGVGISGCGSDGMAKAGSNHEDIIRYFLKEVDFDYKY